jgi:8-oxo-dGTP pyrophosphatase MutT (NUDIX family)
VSKELPVKRYKSAGGVVRSADGEQVLVLLRGERLGPNGRPEVRLPKGHIEPGETPRQAAVREVCEEAGLLNLEILRDLGQQRVEFDWQGNHYVRAERYYLMATTSVTAARPPEAQFERQWLPWTQALARLTFEAEREWVRRARSADSDTRD